MRLVVLLAALVSGCHSITPGPGEEAVIVRRPMFFGSGGVDPDPVRTGRKYVAFTTEGIIIKTVPQAFNQNFDDMNSRDGVPLDFNAQMTLRVTNSAMMVDRFGAELGAVYTSNLAKTFESLTRRAVRNHAESQIATTALDIIDQEVEEGIRSHIKSINIPFELREITIGKSNPPEAIEAQRIQTAAQRQGKITEDERKLKEDARRAAEESRAAADQAYNRLMGLNTEQYVMLQQIAMMRDTCRRGNEQMGGCTFVFGSGSIPLLQVR
jgi:regulator of protease activity HflC (stomatin/prohibitin superfamily)